MQTQVSLRSNSGYIRMQTQVSLRNTVDASGRKPKSALETQWMYQAMTIFQFTVHLIFGRAAPYTGRK